jgi:signal peptidase
MDPKLEVGDIVLSHKVDDVTALKIGDIITFKGEYGDYAGKSITHEIIVEPFKSGDTYYLQTKGIANDYPDPEISEDQIIGKMVTTIPIFRVVYNFFMTPWGLIFVLGFLAILFINEVFALRHIVKENDEDEIKIEYSSSQRGTEKEANNN